MNLQLNLYEAQQIFMNAFFDKNVPEHFMIIVASSEYLIQSQVNKHYFQF